MSEFVFAEINPKPTLTFQADEPYNITFFDEDGTEAGKLIWDKRGMIFKGNQAQSARVFFEYLRGLAENV